MLQTLRCKLEWASACDLRKPVLFQAKACSLSFSQRIQEEILSPPARFADASTRKVDGLICAAVPEKTKATFMFLLNVCNAFCNEKRFGADKRLKRSPRD